MRRRNFKFIFFAVLLVILSGVNSSYSQPPNAYGYSTGYGTVYGTYGLAQTMQTMYNTTRRQIQQPTSSPSAKPAIQSNTRVAAPEPSRVIRNYGVFRPDATTDTGKALSNALGDTPEGKDAILKIYTGTKDAYEKEATPKGWANNIAGGVTFFTVVALTVYHDDGEPSDDSVDRYYAAVKGSLDEMQGLASVSNKDKQNYNNMMIGFAGILLAGYTEAKQTSDADSLANYKKLAGMLITLVLKTDPENLRLVNGRIILK
jgi:hypothetical protein